MEKRGSQSSPGNTRPFAFSLIELLVVIAVVALLVGILLPVLSASRAAAMDTKCKSNLRQVTIAQLTYYQDYRVFSRLWSGSDGDGEAINNPVSPLADYLNVDREQLPKPGSVMQCPAVDPGEFDRLAPLVLPGQQVSSFGINPAMQFDRWSFDPDVNGAVSRSSELILVGEQAVEPFEQLQTADGITAVPLAYGGAVWRILPYHDPYRAYRHAPGGANFAMLDGSARRLFHDVLDLDGKHWTWWDTSNDTMTMSISEYNDGCGCN
ncbi:MAG: H-X9-DG-CTERM domain-containing protein [Planctomycetota bacterium]